MNTSSYFGQIRYYLEKRSGVLAPINGEITATIGEWLGLSPQITGCVLSKMSAKDLLQFVGPSSNAPKAIWLPPKHRNYPTVTSDDTYKSIFDLLQHKLDHGHELEVYGSDHLAVLSGLPPTVGELATQELEKFQKEDMVIFDTTFWPWELMLHKTLART